MMAIATGVIVLAAGWDIALLIAAAIAIGSAPSQRPDEKKQRAWGPVSNRPRLSVIICDEADL